MIHRIATILLVLLSTSCCLAVDGLAPFWTRDKDSGAAVNDVAVRYQNQPSLRIQHSGQNDWCLNSAKPLGVKEGDIVEVTAAVKIAQGSVSVAAVLYDAHHNALSWSYGATEERGQGDWKQVSARMVIPAGATSAVPRIMGFGRVEVWIGAFSYKIAGRLEDLRQGNVPSEIQLRNKTIQATFVTRDATLRVTNLRTGNLWVQSPPARDWFVKSVIRRDQHIEAQLMEVASNAEFSATFELDGDRPEILVKLAGSGALRKPLAYPAPFVTAPGSYLVVPMNEGISYPVDDESIHPMRLIAYGGHGICMPFFGATDGSAGYSAIFETPDDASTRIDRSALPTTRPAATGGSAPLSDKKLLTIAPEWDAQRGLFGYERRIRYCFFDTGGHVAIDKRYRQYAQSTGLFKPFTQKQKENPNIDLLIGAVNVWGFDRDAVGMVKQMQAAGIQRILWSSAASPQQIDQLNALSVLTSRYDIYQDVMDPAKFPLLRSTHPDWTTAAWPKDLMLRSDGDWVRGWEVKSKTGEMIPCGVVCDRQALSYADARIGAELKTHAYRGRFIDTTTASPYRECYSPDHPMTRSDSRRYKRELLGLVSNKYHLVCGSETGHDAAVPVCDFFEGMMSLGPYRVPDAGRDMQRILTDVPENVAKFQLGHRYRLPLWELVYHECMVSYWYWGDYNNKLPALWDKRDRFNALYATPPMFMFNRTLWNDQKARFVQSYKASAQITRACGYSEMTDHRFLTSNRDVQQTSFANGMTVTVNFGDTSYRMKDGTDLGGGDIRVDNSKISAKRNLP